MKSRLLLTCLMLALSAWFISANTLHQAFLIGHVNPCDGQNRNVASWIAPVPLTIRRIETFLGTNGGTPFPQVDVFTVVYSSHEPGFMLSLFALDHYVPFTGAHSKEITYPADAAVSLQAGQAITIGHGCTAVTSIPSASQTSVLIWYTTP